MVDAFSIDCPQEPLTKGVCFRTSVGSSQYLYVATYCYLGEECCVLAGVVSDQEPRLLTERCCFSQDCASLHLGDPCICWRLGYPEMHNAPRAEFDDEEDEHRTKEQVVDGWEIAGPYLVSMVV